MAKKEIPKNIHKCRFIKKNVARAKSFSVLRVFSGPIFLVSGIAFSVFVTVVIGKLNSLFYSIGGFMFPAVIILFFITMFLTDRDAERLKYLDELIEAVKKSEIFYLHDKLIGSLNYDNRLKLIVGLINSQNLKQYELIGDIAVAKKNLYLHPNRLIEFMKNGEFGAETRINHNQLLVLESSTRIADEDLERVRRAEPDYYQESCKVKAHKDRFIYADLDKILKGHEAFIKCEGFLIILGAIFFISGIFLLANISYWFSLFNVFGITLIISVPVMQFVISSQETRVNFIKGIVKEITQNDATRFDNYCFYGISLSQRKEMVSNLIKAGKITNREIVDECGVIKLGSKTAYEQLTLKAEDKIRHNAKIIKVGEAITNCLSCGAALKPNALFCGHCGEKVQLYQSEINQQKATAAVKPRKPTPKNSIKITKSNRHN